MAERSRSILFLNHSASRTGASILLLNVLRWLRENSDFNLEVLSIGGGPLVDAFRDVAATRIWRGRGYFLKTVPAPLAAWVGPMLESMHLRMFLRGRRYNLVYANTVATGRYVSALDGCYDSLLWHIHELSFNMNVFLGQQAMRELFPKASRFVAVSQAVVSTLTGDCEVPADRVDLIHGFVPLRKLSLPERRSRRARILASLGWPEESFVVGGCGTLGWRKGSDLFLQVGRCMLNSDASRRVRFLWVGGADQKDDEALAFDHDARSLGLSDYCRRIPSTSDVDDYYVTMDAFALTSREDPFPLVMLEAAMWELPVVCCFGGGGGPEFVGSDCGFVVPYADVGEFASSLLRLYSSPELRRGMGEAGRRKVEMQHSIDVQGPKLLQSIRKCVEPSQGFGAQTFHSR